MHHTRARGWTRLPLILLTAALVVALGPAAFAMRPVPAGRVAVRSTADSTTSTNTTSTNTTSTGTSGTTTTSQAPPTLFGTSIYPNPGETYHDADLRLTKQFGTLHAVRMFFTGMPGSWSTIHQRVGNTPVVVSFKGDPGAIVSGKYDSQLRQWFASAPTTYRTFWSYWHEPEDNFGSNTTQYLAAWRHIAAIANSVGNPQLRSTLILMCWTLNPASGRNWRNYYAGDNVIDVMGFDCYNVGRKKGIYSDPSNLLSRVTTLSNTIHKPFGIAEFGTTVINSDGGVQGRATWLKNFGAYVKSHGGVFATYFDSPVGGVDFRLTDSTSINAWASVVQGG